jgi:hypothetical protein
VKSLPKAPRNLRLFLCIGIVFYLTARATLTAK